MSMLPSSNGFNQKEPKPKPKQISKQTVEAHECPIQWSPSNFQHSRAIIHKNYQFVKRVTAPPECQFPSLPSIRHLAETTVECI